MDYELIKEEVKIAQVTWSIFGWENEMNWLKSLYEERKNESSNL